MAAIAAVASLATVIGNAGDFVGLVSSGLGIIQTLTAKPAETDFYTIRMEIGDNQDAGGNPPNVILTDFANAQFTGVFEGNSKQSRDQCRNDGDIKLYNGLRNAEAPIQSFKTNNGFNLKSVDIQPGGNGICVSNIIIKGSDTQARRDEVFIPIGDLGFQCGHEWNWGAVLDGVKQRCIWLDGQPDAENKPIQSLHLDMENLAGIFNVGKNETLAKTTFADACKFMSDNVGQITNLNACKESFNKRTTSGADETIDTVPVVQESADFFAGESSPLGQYAGAPFITSDNKLWDSEKKEFTDVSPKTAAPAKRSRLFALRDRIAAPAALEERGLAATLKGQRCESAATDGAPKCEIVEEFSIAAA